MANYVRRLGNVGKKNNSLAVSSLSREGKYVWRFDAAYSDIDLTLTGGLALEMEHEEHLEVSSRPSSLNYALPFELLGEIFSHVSEDPLDLQYAILVCRSWHNAAVHHANLWTNIILGDKFLTRFRGARLRDGEAFVRLCVSRSSPFPLHISVHGPGCKSLYGSSDVLYNERVSLVEHILDSNSGEPENLFQRCRSLSWAFITGKSEVVLAARTFITTSFPALEYMTIASLMVLRDYPRIGSPRFPRLKEVTLIDHSERYTPPFFHDDDFANAERLTFIVTSTWMDFDVNCIRRFRSIRILILKGKPLGDDCMETLDDPSKPAELSLLESLTLSGYVHDQLLNLIRTPGLRKLEIEADNTTRWHSLVASNLVHLVGSLEHLCVSFGEGIHGTSWAEELERLIAEAPSLVGVWVSPWMVQYLIGKEWHTKLHVTDPK
jgi:hypothetical protein